MAQGLNSANLEAPEPCHYTMKQYVICLDNEHYPVKLERRKVYEVVDDPIAIQEGFIRVIDETGEDYLYEASRFASVELSQPALEAFAAAHA
jgi:hypothetical protein